MESQCHRLRPSVWLVDQLKCIKTLLNFPVINWKNAAWSNPRLKSGLQQAVHLVICRSMEIKGWWHRTLYFLSQVSKRSGFCEASNSHVTNFGLHMVIETELSLLNTFWGYTAFDHCWRGTVEYQAGWSASRMQCLEAVIDFHHCFHQARD